MGFGSELIRADDWSVSLRSNDRGDDIASANTLNLRTMIGRLAGDSGGYILIPPGRFYLGAITPEMNSEVDSDLRVDPRVTLIFMPGGQLVPLSYAPGEPGYRRPRWQSDTERYKVRIEVQGSIDAGIQQIFDVFIHPELTDIDSMSAEAGTVFFTRPMVGQIYPEWFGAVPAKGAPDALTSNDVRRTTRALQAALDAAHGRMALPDFRTGATATGTVTHYVLNDPGNGFIVGPLNAESVSSNGETVRYAGTRHVLERQKEISTSTELLTFKFNAATNLPAIPVVLNNDYVIDDELWVGAPRNTVSQPRPLLERVFSPRNGSGFVLRGNRGAANASNNVRIIARRSSTFTGQSRGSASKYPDDHPGSVGIFSSTPLYDDASMLSIRGTAGFTVEDVTFDANEVAPRCVTVADTGGGLQNGGFEGCGFLKASSELVHCGAELRLPDGAVADATFSAYFATSNRIWEAQHDLSNLRFARCRFDTVAHQTPDGDHQSATGVFFYAGQSLGVEFRTCVFVGPGNPMVHLLAGRVSFNECHFATTALDDAFQRARIDSEKTTTNGVDIFLDNPPLQQVQRGVRGFPGPATPCIYARDVTSESPQFLTTFTQDPHYATTDAATVLQHVRHYAPTERKQPSVYWNGPGVATGMLEMTGCEFPTWRDGNPVRLGGNLAGTVFDLGNTVHGGAALFNLDPVTSSPVIRSMPLALR